MLKRLYIDNYKCCVNFDIDFSSINLLLGENGAGKTTIFEVLHKLKTLVYQGGSVPDLFHIGDLTRWQTLSKQQFEVEIAGNEGTYKYELSLGYERNKQLVRIDSEKLWFDQHLLLDFQQGTAQLYRDDYSQGPEYPFDWNRSAVGALPSRNDNTRLTWFRERLGRLIVVQIIPAMMSSESGREATSLEPQSQNFVSWYRHLSQNQGKVFEITSELQKVFDGFEYFEFENVGESHRLLKAYFKKHLYRFSELSDGQRTLIVLYALMLFTRQQDYTLCIDEPENYVSLPEIQPWLLQLYDSCMDDELQALLISHHPELINYLASSSGLWFERESNTPVRLSSISAADDLPIAELVARGWIHE